MRIKAITNSAYPNNFPSHLNIEVLNGNHIHKEKVREFMKDADVLLLASESVMPFDRELLDAASKVKYISIDTTDYSWIDIEYAKQKGITISNNPSCSTEAIVEHSLAFMLNYAKKIHYAYQDLYLNKEYMRAIQGTELYGKTLGIIGLGNIGKRLSEVARCLGMNVIAWNKTPKNDSSVHMVELQELLHTSDFISLNITTNKETEKFLDQDKISMIKPGAFILNLADKKLVDNDALLEVLNTNVIGGYGVELWTIEERKEHPIYENENVIAFNSFGWLTKETIERTFKGWVLNVEEYLKGNVLHKVN